MSHPEIKEPSAGHPITIEPTRGRVQVRVNGELIADSTAAVSQRCGEYWITTDAVRG